jgi:hypothetical protein
MSFAHGERHLANSSAIMMGECHEDLFGHICIYRCKDGQIFTVYEITVYMLVNECSFVFGQPINLVPPHKYLTEKSVIGFGRTNLQKAVKN